MERFVLYWEQAEASAQATSATNSHLREHIRTRSSTAILPEFRAEINELRFIRVRRNSAMIPFSAGYRARLTSAGANVQRKSAAIALELEKPPINRPVSDTTATRPSQPGTGLHSLPQQS